MLSKFNPFVLALIILNLGAGTWSGTKGEIAGGVYYVAAAVLNIAVALK